MSILICEIGNILASNIGVTTNVSSAKSCLDIPIQIMEKVELYGKLGIQYSEDCPDITILSNLERTFNIQEVTPLSMLPIIKLQPDIMIYDNTGYLNEENSNCCMYKCVFSMFKKALIATTYSSGSSVYCSIKYHVKYTKFLETSNIELRSTTLSQLHVQGVLDSNKKYQFKTEEIKKVEDATKELTNMVAYDLLCKLIKKKTKKSTSINQLQFRIMDMFRLPNQQEVIDSYQLQIDALKSQLKKYEKSKGEIAELSAKLNRLLE